MFIDAGLTFREFVRKEPLPKSTIQQAIIDFLERRQDAAICGAMAVNAYVDERRMTEDVDIVSSTAAKLADELKAYLADRFQFDMEVYGIGDGMEYRLYQLAKPKKRHLADVWSVAALPPDDRIVGVLVVTPVELIAGKVLSCVRRNGKPKSFTDRCDLARLLLRFPELKSGESDVKKRLEAHGASQETLDFWHERVAEEIIPEDVEDEFS